MSAYPWFMGGRLMWRGKVESSGIIKLVEYDLSEIQWDDKEITQIDKILEAKIRQASLIQDGKIDLNTEVYQTMIVS